MMTLRRVLSRLSVLVLGAAAGCGGPTQREVIQHGPFEIVAEGRKISAGGFPNTSGNPFATTEVTSFAVRYQGRPVVIRHGSRTIEAFWIALRLKDAPRPSLVVGTTDAHLLTEKDGQLVTQSFEREPSTHGIMLQWLDGDAGQPRSALTFGIQRTPLAETWLEGGRYLRSRYAVLDVHTLELRPFDAVLDRGTPSDQEGLNANNQPALVFAPQRTQFVALGQDDRRQPGLLAVDFTNRRTYAIPIDRERTRMRDTRDVTRAWIEHHYAWTRDADGRDRLAVRAEAPPWPWQGRLLPFGGHHVEYRIEPVAEAALPAVRDWIVATFGGSWVPDPSLSSTPLPPAWQPPDGRSRHSVSFRESRVTVYETTALTDPRTAEGEAWTRRIGERLDAELRTGTWDRFFVPTQ